MGRKGQPIGSEALAAGAVTRYELRTYYRALMPNVYLGRGVEPSLGQRTVAAWLWSRREAVIAGQAAAALHGAKWVDDNAAVELIWRNGRAPRGVITRDELLLDAESQRLDGLSVTTAGTHRVRHRPARKRRPRRRQTGRARTRYQLQAW